MLPAMSSMQSGLEMVGAIPNQMTQVIILQNAIGMAG